MISVNVKLKVALSCSEIQIWLVLFYRLRLKTPEWVDYRCVGASTTGTSSSYTAISLHSHKTVTKIHVQK